MTEKEAQILTRATNAAIHMVIDATRISCAIEYGGLEAGIKETRAAMDRAIAELLDQCSSEVKA